MPGLDPIKLSICSPNNTVAAGLVFLHSSFEIEFISCLRRIKRRCYCSRGCCLHGSSLWSVSKSRIHFTGSGIQVIAFCETAATKPWNLGRPLHAPTASTGWPRLLKEILRQKTLQHHWVPRRAPRGTRWSCLSRYTSHIFLPSPSSVLGYFRPNYPTPFQPKLWGLKQSWFFWRRILLTTYE